MTDRFGYGEIGLDINTRHPCDGCRDFDAPDGCKSNGGCGRTQTNADHIRSMSDEELAEILHNAGGNWYTVEYWTKWLKSPTDKEGE